MTGEPISPHAMPKIIWIMWLQGLAVAPKLVKQCVHSWQRHNPNWKIIFLDEQNLKEYVKTDDIVGRNRETITVQALTDIIRINLLAQFGGVWVDATCFCCRPMDEWIEKHLTTGFFAFDQPGKDRLISSWFLASKKNCHLTAEYCRATNAYWRENHFPFQKNFWRKKTIKWAGKILERNARLAGLWVHPLTIKLLRVHPYHWFHYTFYRVVTTDERSGELWRQTPKISADIPHRLQSAGFLKPVSIENKASIDGRKDPLYKLSWRCDPDLAPGCNLDYLLRSQS
jgi:hypothetical protein